MKAKNTRKAVKALIWERAYKIISNSLLAISLIAIGIFLCQVFPIDFLERSDGYIIYGIFISVIFSLILLFISPILSIIIALVSRLFADLFMSIVRFIDRYNAPRK